MTRATSGRLLAAVLLVLSTVAPASAQDPAYLPPEDRAPAVAALVQSYHSAGLFDGSVLAAVGDEVVYRGAVGLADREFRQPNEPGTVFRLASVTKQFTAAAVLRLAEDGLVELDQSVSDYLPTLPADTWGDVTLRRLLTHTAGVPQNIEELGAKGMGDHFRMDEMIRLLASARLPGRPGRRFHYSNAGYVVAAAVIERVTDRPYGAAIDALFFEPLGMSRTAHEVRQAIVPRFAQGYVKLPDKVLRSAYEDKSYVTGAGSIYSSVDDLFTWSRAVQTGRVLGADAADAFVSRQVDPGYAYGWFTFGYHPPTRSGTPESGTPHPAVTHGGGAPGFSTTLRWYLDHDITVIVLANQEDAPTNSLANQIGNVLLGSPDTTLRTPSVSPRVYLAALEEGVAAARRVWRELQSTAPDSLPKASHIDETAFLYLRAERPREALALFELQVALFPDSADAYDSLGEGYLAAGQPARALAAYETALELDPDHAHARAVLDHLSEALIRQASRIP